MTIEGRDTVLKVATNLQPIANALDQLLTEVAGERLSFVLVVCAAKTSQYVSNCARRDGQELLRDLLARWDANRADIPATMNPDIATPLRMFDVTFKHQREQTAATFVQVPANDAADARMRAQAMLAVTDQWEVASVVDVDGEGTSDREAFDKFARSQGWDTTKKANGNWNDRTVWGAWLGAQWQATKPAR